MSKSHYTCHNLSGVCSIYYYINATSANDSYSVAIRNGKYVSTDLTDTNNILYDIYEKDDINVMDSTIKRYIESWYSDNLYNNYDSDIDDTVYCNNRTITSFGSWNPENPPHTNYELKFKESTVSGDLSCTKITDRFSISNSYAELNYKVGLITSPEMYLINAGSARKSAAYYWLMSPYSFSSDRHFTRYIHSSVGSIENSQSMESRSIRPAIALKSGIEYTRGTGKTDDPYVVE